MEFDIDKLECTCCFCNQGIVSTSVDPCDLNILINWDKPKNDQMNQSFYCHIACFKEKLHSKMKSYLMIDTIEDENDK
jgi:hypothetical protein